MTFANLIYQADRYRNDESQNITEYLYSRLNCSVEYDSVGISCEQDITETQNLNDVDNYSRHFEFDGIPILSNIVFSKGNGLLKRSSETNQYLSSISKLDQASLNRQFDENLFKIKLLNLRVHTFDKLHKQLETDIEQYEQDEDATQVVFEQIHFDFLNAKVMFDKEHDVDKYFPELAKNEVRKLNQQTKDLEKAIKDQEILKEKQMPKLEVANTSLGFNHIESYFNDFIGLDSVKSEIKKLVAFLSVQEARRKQGFTLKNPPTKHMVFTGNPGTGKTEMARLTAKIFYETGIIKKNVFVEADRSSLIAEYLGQTAIKTKELIERAIGGVLFIDEAYAIKTRHDDSYGDEAISTLLKMMEDNRDNLTVIVAGYENEMKVFLETNPGLRSRFNRFINFPDYSPNELFQILLKMCKGNHYQVESLEKLSIVVPKLFENVMQESEHSFANARFVRNYFESLIERQSLRVVSKVDEDINLLKLVDFKY